MRSIPEVMQKLHWTTPDGCSSCRPALNYYLLCALPGDYVDDQQSRFVNERLHANIQKDGTYSVVPRMWGGLTNPTELRAIADVVEKYDAPMVKVTGRSEEHTSELQSLMRISYAVFCLKKKNNTH